jgi:hypothetical protein
MARLKVYCVQPYAGSPGRLEPCALQQFGDELEALKTGAAISGRRGGVLVFEASGGPDPFPWETRVLATYGATPTRA